MNPPNLVETALKTEVIDILRENLSQLAGLDRVTAYETVLDQPELLHRAFTLLKLEPERFASVIVDVEGKPVEPADYSNLRCGDTLGTIKTQVLRATARRHFRHHLGGPRTVVVRTRRQISTLRMLMEKIGLVTPPPVKRRKVMGKGDSLYHAMRDYLIFDWQAALIPHYTQFEPDLVDKLGGALLEIREPSELRALSGEEGRNSVKQQRRPLFLSHGRLLVQPNGEGLDADRLGKLWKQMGLERLYSESEKADSRKVVADLSATTKAAIEQLLPILGHDARLFVAFFFIAYRRLGRSGYREIFSESGTQQWRVEEFAKKLTQIGMLPLPELEEMKSAFGEIIGNAPDLG